MNPSPLHPSQTLDATQVQRVIIAVIVVGLSLFLGVNIPTRFLFAAGLVLVFFLGLLLLQRPHAFILFTLFFLFQAFELVDVERFARLPGLFKAKDVFISLLLVYTLASLAVGRFAPGSLRRSKLFTPLIIFLLFVIFQAARTKIQLGESTILLIRHGRHFFTYGAAFVLLLFFQTERHWKLLDRFCVFFVWVTTFTNALQAAGVPLPAYMTSVSIDIRNVGALKSYNPAFLLSYWFFFRCFWMYCAEASAANARRLAMYALPVCFYFFRSFLAASLVATLVVAFWYVAPRVRTRALLTVLVAAALLVIVNLAVVAVVKSHDVSGLAQVMRRYLAGTFTEVVEVSGTYASRIELDRFRYPLIREHPLLGTGFISVFGHVAWEIWRSGYLPVGTADTGWVDMMMNLGGIGFAILLFLFMRGVQLGAQLMRRPAWSASDRSVICADGTLFIMAVISMVASNPLGTESGITTLAIAFARMMYLERQGPARSSAPLPAPQKDGPAERRLLPVVGHAGG